jgi:hypothetical protein
MTGRATTATREPAGMIGSPADAETLESRRRYGSQFHSASWQLKVGGERLDDRVVRFATVGSPLESTSTGR